MDYMRVFDIIYALAAVGGREQALFGSSAPFARDALARSLACESFPELWFELPLAGEPWFDLHALVAYEDVDGRSEFDSDRCGGFPEVFGWFATQGNGVRQLALSWDSGTGRVSKPAIQLLRRCVNTELTCGFLEAAGRDDAVSAYRTFERQLPKGWFACYTGVFPTRREPFLRVECIPRFQQQKAYADDSALLAAHLNQVGLTDLDDELLYRCQVLAGAPFQFEFQFDVTPEGAAGSTFGASVRFAMPANEGTCDAFDPNGAAGELMHRVQEWGLSDDRWRLIAKTAYAKKLASDGENCLVYCYPAFLKLRWRGGKPLDAKTYLIAGVQK